MKRQTAQAKAQESVAKAQSDTATIAHLANNHDDPDLMGRIYRQRIAEILSKAGSVVTVSPQDDAHLILQGVEQKDNSTP